MVYPKKMLILTGEGTGVVLIEKSARGVRFSLSTFDMPVCGDLKAGVITPRAVYVRDLPPKDNPSLVFMLDIDGADDLHFAVFDSKLRLYGTNGKRMWEANVMGLLVKNDRKPADVSPIAPLPPLVKPPEILPSPDGTGIPQSRLSLYGDEAIAQSDFYTPLDFSARMPEVDRFLDAPRVLEELAPRIIPRSRAEAAASTDVEQTVHTVERADTEEIAVTTQNDGQRTQSAEIEACEHTDTEESNEQLPADLSATGETEGVTEGAEQADIPETKTVGQELSNDVDPAQETATVLPAEHSESNRNEQSAAQSGTEKERPPRTERSDEKEPSETDESPTEGKEKETDEMRKMSETGTYAESPSVMEARYLRRRSGRTLDADKGEVKPLRQPEHVKPIREPSFTELASSDIDKLFSDAPKDEELSALLPDAQWVRVETDGNAISVGRGEGFLCYAVKGHYRKNSPLGDSSQWLPANRAAPTGKGYWLIFQNATTGEIMGS